MRTIKVLAIIGLAVALVAVPALAQQPIKLPEGAAGIEIEFASKVTIDALHWTKDRAPIAEILIPDFCKGEKTIIDILVVIGQPVRISCDGQVGPLPTPPAGTTDIRITLKSAATIKKANWLGSDGRPLREVSELQGKQARFIDLDFTNREVTVTVPTLTEWGLIALAVLLAGGMGYMIYRRRPALRPAAP